MEADATPAERVRQKPRQAQRVPWWMRREVERFREEAFDYLPDSDVDIEIERVFIRWWSFPALYVAARWDQRATLKRWWDMRDLGRAWAMFIAERPVFHEVARIRRRVI